MPRDRGIRNVEKPQRHPELVSGSISQQAKAGLVEG